MKKPNRLFSCQKVERRVKRIEKRSILFRVCILRFILILFALGFLYGNTQAQYFRINTGGASAVQDSTGINATITYATSGSVSFATNQGTWLNGVANPATRTVGPAFLWLPPNTTDIYGVQNLVSSGATGTVTFTFSRVVHNPLVNVSMLGPSSISVSAAYNATNYPAPTVTKLAGNNNIFVSSGHVIDGSTSGGGGDCGPSTTSLQGCGSFRVVGDFTSLTLVLTNPVGSGTADGFSMAISSENDFGDAPAQYGVAVHAIDNSQTYYMGSGVPDLEGESLFSANADGDDLRGIDDENAFVSPGFRTGYSSKIPITVSGTAGYLQCWIDYNQNGVFDSTEQVATNLQDGAALDTDPTVGKIAFNVNVPSTATLGNTYLRLRWAPTSGVAATGSVIHGEVEDYVITLNAAPFMILVKDCTSPSNCKTSAQLPGTDLTYNITYQNNGNAPAANVNVIDAIPANTDFKIGSVTSTPLTTGLVFTFEYSSDYNSANPTAATWTYTPVSGGGGAALGYDRNVKAIRWRSTSGSLPYTSPNSVGWVTFKAKIR
ncbi:MAG: GEVED domain-containing protein [Pyrinomonadaceae bacterium]